MAIVIEVQDDVLGFKQDVHGNDNRINGSTRGATRRYYNSRDKAQTYSFVWNFNAAESTEFAAYLQNTSLKTLVLSAVGLNAELASRFQLHKVTGTASDGNVITPLNDNFSSSNVAEAICREGGSGATGVQGLTSVGIADYAFIAATGHEEFRIGDTVRLGQNDAVAIQVLEQAAAGDVGGVIFFYFE